MSNEAKKDKFIKYCIANALCKLMDNNTFEKITVNEICNEAHIGRATYYNHANGKKGKEELLNFKLSKDYDEYVKTRERRPNDGGDLLNFVLVNKKLFAKLHEYRLSNVIIDFLLYTNKYEEDRQDNEYISHYTCFGYLGLMYQWYRNGFKESPAEICDIIRNKYIEILDEINKKRNND